MSAYPIQANWILIPFARNSATSIHDDIRLIYGMNLSASYPVQGRRNPIKERYLRSLGVNTVWLDSWNDLPEFLARVHPAGPSTPLG